jgi:hypothetical protein
MNLFVSSMRTVVPLVAGALLTLATSTGVSLDGTATNTAVTGVLTAAYYLAFRSVEELAGRLGAGWLRTAAGVVLGWARPPQYPAPASVTPTSTSV